VPLDSARSKNIFADKTIELDAAHRELPTKAQKDILEILTGIKPATEVKHSLIKDILLISVFSPIDIQIISPSGKIVGKNFETGGISNEIEDAYYSGYDTDNEFLTIPNPEDGEYRIIAKGTGSGSYKIEVSKISEDSEGQASEAVVEILGTAETNGEYQSTINTLADFNLSDSDNTAASDNSDSSDSGNEKNHSKKSSSTNSIVFAMSTDEASDLAMNTNLFPNNDGVQRVAGAEKNSDVPEKIIENFGQKSKMYLLILLIITAPSIVFGFYLRNKNT
jgi:hypothetical protein